MATDHATHVIERTRCRACEHDLEFVLSLGNQFVNAFPDFPAPHDDLVPRVPLEVMRCPRCALVQLRHTTPPDWLYKWFWYRSGVNESMRAALRDIVLGAVQRVRLDPGDFVVDIGANDGTLLQQYADLPGVVRPVRVAFEPARNVYQDLRQHADIIFTDYFTARKWPSAKKAKIVTAIAMFYDLEDPHTFLEDVRQILADDGVFVIQLGDLGSMLRHLAVDVICHEHLMYYSLSSLHCVTASHGLLISEVERNEVNGGSLRVYLHHEHDISHPVLPGVPAMLDQEFAAGLVDGSALRDFADRVDQVKRHVLATIDRIRSGGGVVDIYGASTKGNTLLQTWGLNHEIIRRAIDRSPEKWGKYTVGSGIPIVSEEVGRQDPAALWLCLPWHFRRAFLEREAEYLAKGGTMLFPLPHAEIVSGVLG